MTWDPLRIHNLKKTFFKRCCRTLVFSFSGSWGLHFAIFKNTCSKCPEITAYKVVHLGCDRGQLFLAMTTTTLDRVSCQFWNSPGPPLLWTVQMKQSYYSACVYFIPQWTLFFYNRSLFRQPLTFDILCYILVLPISIKYILYSFWLMFHYNLSLEPSKMQLLNNNRQLLIHVFPIIWCWLRALCLE